MLSKYALLLFFAVYLFSCNEGDNDKFVQDNCGQPTDGIDDLGTASDDEVDTERTMTSDSEESTGEDLTDSEEDTEDTSKIISDAAYESLVAAGIFVEEGAIFTTSYYEGYNFNFEISEEQAHSLLPDNLAPIKIKILESDPEPRYYLSWYMAVVDAGEAGMNITRIDLFTFAERENGELSLYFVSSYMDVPQAFREDPAVFAVFGTSISFERI